jgi:hypothetical protein
MLRSDEEFDASGDAGLASDEAGSLESEDHLMDGWWADAEVALHVGFGGRASEHPRIGIDEGQVLALRYSKAWCTGLARRA